MNGYEIATEAIEERQRRSLFLCLEYRRELRCRILLHRRQQGWTHEQILTNYPQLTSEDVLAALHDASGILQQEKVYPLTV